MASNLKKEFVNHKKFLYDTFGLAHQAVKFDGLSQEDNQKSTFLYQECSQRFDLLSPFLPQEHSKVLNKYSKVYSYRGTSMSGGRSDAVSFKLPTPVSFREVECDVAISDDQFEKAFDLMNALRATITQDNGSFLLPGFFVPRVVWSQRNFKIREVSVKEAFCRKLLLNLQTLASSPRKVSGLKTFQEKFDLDLHELKQAGLKAKASIERKKVANRLTQWLGAKKKEKRTQSVNHNSTYVALLVKVFSKAQFIKSYRGELEGNQQHFQVLKDTSKKLYFSFLLGVVMKDLNELIENYFRLCRRQFSK